MRQSISLATVALLTVNSVDGFAPVLPGRVAAPPSTRNRLMPRTAAVSDPNAFDPPKEANRKSTDPTPVLFSMFDNVNKPEAKIAAAAMAMALAFLPLNADAAMSGGRMGGSYSSPAPTRSYSAPSSSYSRGYSRGYSSGYMSRPSVAVSPGIGFGYSPFSPFMSPFPGYYGGPGVISYSRGPSFFDLVIFGGFAFALVNFFRNAASPSTIGDVFDSTSVASALGPGTSVVQLSVALEVPNRDDSNSILSALDKISRTARTDSRVGIQNLTSQVALELLRRKSSIVSAVSSSKHFGDRSKARREYEARSVRERSKFERETLNKYGGVDYTSGLSSRASADSGKATMAVVTLVLNIDGDSTKLAKINSISDVEDALRKIASDSKVDDCLQSVEILWTPEDRGEALSMRDVLADYPELRSV